MNLDRIKTPFGEIGIFIDGQEVAYQAQKMACDVIGQKVAGRYMIKIPRISDNRKHIISCCIKDKPNDLKRETDSDEDFEVIEFCRSQVDLSIGVTGDIADHVPSFGRNIFDYDVQFEEDGMSYIQYENTETDYFVFGVCWVDDYYEYDVRTWYGADPCVYGKSV